MEAGIVVLLLVVSVAIFSLVYWMNRGRVSTNEDGDTIMQYGAGYFIASIGVLVFGMACLVFAILGFTGVIMDGKDTAKFLPFVPFGLGTIFAFGGLWMTYEGRCRRVVYNQDGLQAFGWRGEGQFVEWDSIDAVTYNRTHDRYDITADGIDIQVPCALGGQEKFIKRCKKKLLKDVYDNAFKDREQMRPKFMS